MVETGVVPLTYDEIVSIRARVWKCDVFDEGERNGKPNWTLVERLDRLANETLAAAIKY